MTVSGLEKQDKNWWTLKLPHVYFIPLLSTRPAMLPPTCSSLCRHRQSSHSCLEYVTKPSCTVPLLKYLCVSCRSLKTETNNKKSCEQAWFFMWKFVCARYKFSFIHSYITWVRQEARRYDAQAGISEASGQSDREVGGWMAAAERQTLWWQAILPAADTMVLAVCKK